MKGKKVISIAIGGILVILGLVGAFFIIDSDSSNQTQEMNSELSTVFLETKDLKTYETFDGTLKYENDVRIVAAQDGVLTYLAPEGRELVRGAEIYRIYRSSEASQILSADQQIASADASVAQAELALENLTAAPTAVQIASADASVAQAEAAVSQGEDAISSAHAARLIARESLCAGDTFDDASWLCPQNLRGEPFPDELIASLSDMISNGILSAAANNLLNAQKNYDAALQSQKTLEKNQEQALESRLALDEPPTEAELLQVTESLKSAKEQRSALDEPPTEAELLQVTQSLKSALAGLGIAQETSNNLVEGYSASLLMFGNTPAWRDMKEGIAPGEDVYQLKLNLIALGYGTIKTLGSDWDFNAATTAAITKLQEDMNLILSGEILLGEVVFTPGTSLVKSSSTLKSVGDKMNVGTELFYLTPIEKVETKIESDGSVKMQRESLQAVEIQVDVSDRGLVNEGSKVEIELPDESVVEGTVREVATLAVVPQEGDPFLEVLIAVEGTTEYFEWTGATVTINVTKELASGVLASPVNGLLALLSGGYALETVTASGTNLIPVETGIYADGWVEVSGPGLQPGTEIIVAGQ